MMKRPLVIDPTRSLYAICHAFPQTRQTPFREGDTDYRDFEGTSFRHCIECGKDHFVGEIARHTEEHKRIRTGGSHQAASFVIIESYFTVVAPRAIVAGSYSRTYSSVLNFSVERRDFCGDILR
jgi:hypothetical protein